MLTKLINSLLNKSSTLEVHAHCDGPCGVYDPASTRVAAEAVLAMTKKLIALTPQTSTESADWDAYSNTFSRFVAVKEEQAKETKKEILILWTDYFLSLIHISEPTRLGMISYAVFCLSQINTYFASTT